MKNKSTLFLVQAALIAAVYVVLTLVFAPFSYGEIQVRISEALTILPFFTPAAIPGLFVGCILANLLGGAIPLDIAFGSIATLIGAVFTYKLRNSNKWLAPVPPIVANAVLVPFVLRYGYSVNLPIPLMMLTVGAGEIISCGIFGMVLLTALSKYKNTLFGKQAAAQINSKSQIPGKESHKNDFLHRVFLYFTHIFQNISSKNIIQDTCHYLLKIFSS